MKLPHLSKKYAVLVFFSLLLIYAPIAVLSLIIYQSNKSLYSLRMSHDQIKTAQDNFRINLSEELFNEHLSLQGKQNLENQLTIVEDELEKLKNTTQGTTYTNTTAIYDLYDDFGAKLKRNENAKLKTDDQKALLTSWGAMLIDQKFDELQTQIVDANKILDNAYDEYIASLPPPMPPASSGYSYVNISTEKGNFSVNLIKVPMSSVRVKTVSASAENCKDNCPTKSLADYIKENNGFAGMNGSYFCPPDYSTCSGKINSFDYAFYNSSKKKWLNKDALSWDKTGLITFSGGSGNFYKKSSEYDGDGIEAGISNYPSLLKNGEVVVRSDDMTSYQKIKGTRGAIGLGGENIYLAIIYNATVEEAAYVMRALGAKHALNLDGGGSTAMYVDGRYVAGPGRSLPNAIILTR